jgi:DNA mismatch repair ATPase MutS
MPRFVSVSPAERTIVATDLAHPLLPVSHSVPNDVQVGPSGTVLLVTGSNMSGKSTLLRALGSNTILAQLGAPVCATGMTLSPMRIETSMRIQDSLADGVSFFMAELKRLKQIVDVARQYEHRADCCVLFLLDEILQGTNSRERHVAVTRVVSHLIRHGAIGAVSTHDLELGSAPELRDACRPVHFRESFTMIDGDKKMTFDYVARDGIATTTNALELLKLVGLDEGENDLQR